ncbi:MAG: bifunctional alpha,alpha-trehalose-phosphate synthase (UDP-forming)/trehalose-phosphatase [Ignavibacteriales bacterium]|nr:bifunctional alpha,alpha-trehalose-phosphate synthase (UDP-forming)/trehalose-phosphatase [Ignavibacteriales bacterium]
MSETPKKCRLIIVSNRLPFTAKEKNGELHFGESAGGLVSGMSSFLKTVGTSNSSLSEYLWIGWPGGTVSEKNIEELKSIARSKYSSYPVFLTEEEMDQFYLGFCNKTIWPLFHYFPTYTAYQPDMWQQYKKVNQVFAQALLEVVQPDDLVWIHDYHLLLMPNMVKSRAPGALIGFFLHIPFPSHEIFRLLPGEWRKDILEGLMGADVLGFHAYDYTQHFLQCVVRILGHEHNMGLILTTDRVMKTDTFPMGIDVDRFISALDDSATQNEIKELKKSLPGVKAILSVDRQDYTKGILNRLEAFEILLESHPEFREKVVLLMIVVPSRIGVDRYDKTKKEIEELVGKINGKFGSIGWTPVVYQYKQVPFPSLVALYHVSDVALVTPLRDGMNLVAKEYVASRVDNTGVLVLSEMAGAAKELGEAIIINPNNREEIAAALAEAVSMPIEEQQRRNRMMRGRIKRYNVIRWANDFLSQLLAMRDVQNKFYVKLLSEPIKTSLVSDYRKSVRRLLFLDYDGTLVPFVRRPEMAKPSDEVSSMLRMLCENKKNTVVLISGRDKATLGQWFGDACMTLVAEHGIWVRKPREEWKMFKEQSADWKPHILPILEQYGDRLPGSSVEEKEYSLVWHYRGADPEQSNILAHELLDHLTNFTANIDLQVLRGNKVIEVRAAGLNKGSVGLHILSSESFDFVLSIGDDWTDEDLFKVLPESAVSIKVGIANTHARYTVQNIQEVHRLLNAFAGKA